MRRDVVLELLISVLFCAPAVAVWAMALYRAYRTGTVSVKGRKLRRDKDPFNYWISLSTSAIGLLVLAAAPLFVLWVSSLGR